MVMDKQVKTLDLLRVKSPYGLFISDLKTLFFASAGRSAALENYSVNKLYFEKWMVSFFLNYLRNKFINF